MDIVGIIVIVAIVVILAVVFFALYNKLVALRNDTDNAWSQIDVQLKRRADLIPNLINTVKGYAKHEAELLNSITDARSALQNASTPGEAAKADNALGGLLPQIYAVAENYPDLKASANFVQLQEELSSTENKVAFARQYYNDSVLKLNTKVETVPFNLVAGMAKAHKRDYFEVPAGSADREVPTVSF